MYISTRHSLIADTCSSNSCVMCVDLAADQIKMHFSMAHRASRLQVVQGSANMRQRGSAAGLLHNLVQQQMEERNSNVHTY